jgi:hypothetical protein
MCLELLLYLSPHSDRVPCWACHCTRIDLRSSKVRHSRSIECVQLFAVRHILLPLIRSVMLPWHVLVLLDFMPVLWSVQHQLEPSACVWGQCPERLRILSRTPVVGGMDSSWDLKFHMNGVNGRHNHTCSIRFATAGRYTRLMMLQLGGFTMAVFLGRSWVSQATCVISIR